MGYTSYQNNVITYKSDIIKEMSSELGIPEDEIEEIVNLNIKYIKEVANKEDSFLITLPNLCKLRFNYKLGLSSTFSRKKNVSIIKKKVKFLIEYRKNNKELPLNFIPPLFDRMWRKYNKKYIKYIYGNMYKMIKDVELKSKETTNKIKE